MWQNDGYDVWGRKRIIGGPNLEKLIASNVAFLAGDCLTREFTTSGTSMHISDKRINGCVAGIEPITKERVNLKLVSRPGDDFGYTIVYGYNHHRHCGNAEEFRKSKERALGYAPVRIMTTSEMMELNDQEYALMYGAHMMTYLVSSAYQFPMRCQNPGCIFVLQHPLDMRKLGGQVLCPKCFVEEVARRESQNPYLVRAAAILPSKSIVLPIWPEGLFGPETEGE